MFIDKDGTLIPDIPYNVDPALITLAPRAGEVLRQLRDAGYLLVVVSNQAGIARGLFDEAALGPVAARLDDLLRGYGVALDGFYYCPHLPDADVPRYAVECTCRKPHAGMLLSAAHDLRIDLARSWLVGDITTDSEAGKRASCRTILIEKPYDPIGTLTERNRPDYIVRDWPQAGRHILAAVSEWQPVDSQAQVRR